MRHLGTIVALALSFLAASTACSTASGAESEFTVVIKDHRFQPAELRVPAGQRVKLVVDNQDPTPEEFESHDLRREKVIPGHSKGVVWIGPLPKGEYGYYGEFHEDTAQGRIIAE